LTSFWDLTTAIVVNETTPLCESTVTPCRTFINEVAVQKHQIGLTQARKIRTTKIVKPTNSNVFVLFIVDELFGYVITVFLTSYFRWHVGLPVAI
jgi:hypothetical protein